MRIAVISDIHASHEPGDSWLTTSGAKTPLQDPVESLLLLIEKEGLVVDYLVCCGDIGNRAHPAGIQYGWTQINKIANKLGARVIATAGNHDVDSRFKYNSFDAKGQLQKLSPPFPFSDDALNDRFWSRNYATFTEGPVRFVVLNSAAYHGHQATDSLPEYEHGRIAETTTEAIKVELEASESKALVNILVCHHHPHRHGDLVSVPDYSTMEDGHRLIDVLNAHTKARWLVMHGHKHQPRMCYAAGHSNAPVIFGAGSFSVKLDPDVSQIAKNQFYVFTFDVGEQVALRMDLAGMFQAFDWVTSIGWLRAGEASGLPAFGGFGCTLNRSADAVIALEAINDIGEGYVRWSEIVAHVPKFKYLLPADRNALFLALKQEYGVRTAVEFGGTDYTLAAGSSG